jgi:hypothetical protein
MHISGRAWRKSGSCFHFFLLKNFFLKLTLSIKQKKIIASLLLQNMQENKKKDQQYQ